MLVLMQLLRIINKNKDQKLLILLNMIRDEVNAGESTIEDEMDNMADMLFNHFLVEAQFTELHKKMLGDLIVRDAHKSAFGMLGIKV